MNQLAALAFFTGGFAFISLATNLQQWLWENGLDFINPLLLITITALTIKATWKAFK